MYKIATFILLILLTCSCSISREKIALVNKKLEYEITYFDDYALIEVSQIEVGVIQTRNAKENKSDTIKSPQIKALYNKPFLIEIGGLVNNSILVKITISGNIVKIGTNIQSSKVVLASDALKSQ